MSDSPGINHLPVPSIVVTPAGTVSDALGATATMRSPRTTTVYFASSPPRRRNVVSGELTPRMALWPARRPVGKNDGPSRSLLAIDGSRRRFARQLIARRFDAREERHEVLAENLLDLGLAVAAPQQ